MLMHAISHEGCTEIVRESALEVDSGREKKKKKKKKIAAAGTRTRVSIAPGFSVGPVPNKQHHFCGREATWSWSFQSDAVPTEPSPP